MPRWFPLKEKMHILIKTRQGNGAPLRPLHATWLLTAPPPVLSSLGAWLLSPCVTRPCQVTPCLPSRLPAAGQTSFISWFSSTILSDNLTPLAFFWASLLESWAFGSWAPRLSHPPPTPWPQLTRRCHSHPLLSQTSLFPIRGTCILNVSAVSVSVATVPLLPPFPDPLPRVTH